MQTAIATMLARSLKQPQSVAVLFFVVCVVLWLFERDLGTSASTPLSNGDLVRGGGKEMEKGKEGLRIALITFITDQKSYIHVSLMNKDRKSLAFHFPSFVASVMALRPSSPTDDLAFTQTTHVATTSISSSTTNRIQTAACCGPNST